MPRRAIYTAGQVVTLAGPNRPRIRAEMRHVGAIPSGAIVIEDGRVAAVGPSNQVLAENPGVEIHEFGQDRVITPGLIDAHTHPVFGGDRVDEFEQRVAGASYEEIARAGGGILSTVAKTCAAGESDLLGAAKRRAGWFLRCGTTAIEAKSGYGLDLETELKMLRVIRALGRETPLDVHATFLGLHAVPPEFARDPSVYANLVEHTILPAVADGGLARFADAFCESIAFDKETVRRVMSAARDAGLGLRLHVDQLTAGGGAELAAELGAVTADHLEQTGAEGIGALAKAGVQPVLLPGSVYALGKSKYPDARAMIDAGLAVVLATDFNPGSSPTPSLPFAMSLACVQMHMTPAEALTACTVNAAGSLGILDRAGSLEPGKRADFVVWDAADYREIAYWVGAPLVRGTFVKGVPVFDRPTHS